MPQFTVSWEIDVDAETYEEAARKAREVQLNRDSIATVFEVVPFAADAETRATSTRVLDLSRIDGRPVN